MYNIYISSHSRSLVDEGPKISLFSSATRYAWRISKLELFLSFFVELLEFSEDRHPWESVEEKLDAIRYELLGSIILPFIVPPSNLSSSLPLPFRPCVSPFLPRSPFSLPFQLLFPSLHPCRISLGRYFTTLPSSFSLPMPFSRLCLPSSPCPFLSHRPWLLFFLPFPLALRFPHSTNSPMIFHSVTVFLTTVILVFLRWQLSLVRFFFQRHDEKDAKTDDAWTRVKICSSRWLE